MQIINGDCLHALRGMPDNSVDAVVTDPPYGLSNTSPDKVTETIVRWAQGDREYVPAGKGFMGAEWDGFVPPPAVWDECYRVLKPGGHMAVFAGTRTMDLMGLSIRLAGFDVRDSLAWLYGSGFPKSQDVSKAIEKSKTLGDSKVIAKGCGWIADRCDELGLSRKDLDAAAGTSDMGGWWASRLPHRANLPTAEQWMKLKPLLGDAPEWLDKFILPANTPGEAWGKREIVATRTGAQSESTGRYGAWGNDDGAGRSQFNVTTSATDTARRWSGWGSNLKPAFEPIILARKPFPGTIASNVVEWGTGAINIDATRIGVDQAERETIDARSGSYCKERDVSSYGIGERAQGETFTSHAQGRFPANVALDPVAADALDQQSGTLKSQQVNSRRGGMLRFHGFHSIEDMRAAAESGGKCPDGRDAKSTYERYMAEDQTMRGYVDEGGASRFFHVAEPDAPFLYCAKAPKKERPTYTDDEGNTVQHPTVKPVSIMRWLVRLITPPGGTVLDPFAGSGTTVEAALLEGFNPVAIEAHGPYIRLIEQRVGRATEAQTRLDVA